MTKLLVHIQVVCRINQTLMHQHTEGAWITQSLRAEDLPRQSELAKTLSAEDDFIWNVFNLNWKQNVAMALIIQHPQTMEDCVCKGVNYFVIKGIT